MKTILALLALCVALSAKADDTSSWRMTLGYDFSIHQVQSVTGYKILQLHNVLGRKWLNPEIWGVATIE